MFVFLEFDNDGVPDRYANDFKNGDYFELNYAVNNSLHSKEEIA